MGNEQGEPATEGGPAPNPAPEPNAPLSPVDSGNGAQPPHVADVAAMTLPEVVLAAQVVRVTLQPRWPDRDPNQKDAPKLDRTQIQHILEEAADRAMTRVVGMTAADKAVCFWGVDPGDVYYSALRGLRQKYQQRGTLLGIIREDNRLVVGYFTRFGDNLPLMRTVLEGLTLPARKSKGKRPDRRAKDAARQPEGKTSSAEKAA